MAVFVHQTITKRFNGEHGSGWEFNCLDCSYHARYLPSDEGKQELEILDPGDPEARHTSSHVESALTNRWDDNIQEQAEIVPELVEELDEAFDDEGWLTPELRQQLAVILARLDE